MRLIDVHCHLESTEYPEGPGAEVEAARRAGVVKLVTSSIVPEQWEHSRALAVRFAEVEFAVGIHPWYIRPEHEAELQRLASAREWGAIAIGEIGLDRHVDEPAFDEQVRFFEAQLAVARNLELPTVIHCRGAFNELLECIKRVGTGGCGGVIHNFSGSVEIADMLRRHGFVFSLGGVLTYRNSPKKKALLKAIYPDALALETDSPDISPVEAPGRPNVPANIVYNLRAAAELLERDEEEVAEATTLTASRIFNLAV